MLTQTEKHLSGIKKQGHYIREHYPYMFGVVASKNWAELFQLEVLINTFKFTRIIELGTGTGATTLLMAINCKLHNIVLYTFDKIRIDHNVHCILQLLNANVHEWDIFEDQNVRYIKGLIRTTGRTLLYCDNGNKPEELLTFCPALKKGDIVLVHDYGEEVKQPFIEMLCKEKQMRVIEKEFFQDNFTSLHLGLEKL